MVEEQGEDSSVAEVGEEGIAVEAEAEEGEGEGETQVVAATAKVEEEEVVAMVMVVVVKILYSLLVVVVTQQKLHRKQIKFPNLQTATSLMAASASLII